jgi:PmbA protein
MTDPRDFLTDLIARARKAGADSADAVLSVGESLSVAWRLGKVEKLERAEGHDLGLRVFVGRQQAMVSTTDHSPANLTDFIERAVAMAKAVPEDPYCGVADPDQLAKSFPELDHSDPFEPTAETLLEWARVAEEAARAIPGVTNSEGADAGWRRGRTVLATSAGFAGIEEGTSFSLSASVLAGEGTGMERDYDWTAAVYASDLEPAALIGQRAGERAVKRLNPRRVVTTKAPVLFDPRVSSGLLRHLSSAISGGAIARGTSFLKDRMGQRIMSAGVNVIDDPHRPRGFRSSAFDGEGLPTQRRAIIEDGVLTTWLLDLRSSRQLNLAPTGHASRGTGSAPSPSPANLYFEPGEISRADLIKGVKSGLYVTEMLGMGVNGVTGDYSRGAAGYWIENGELAYPVSEITIAGNLKEMFLNLTVADDLVFRSGVDAPTVRIDGLTIAGQNG